MCIYIYEDIYIYIFMYINRYTYISAAVVMAGCPAREALEAVGRAECPP